MTTLAQASSAVASRWLTQWVDDGVPLTRTVFENEAWSEPAVPLTTPVTSSEVVAASWVRLSIRQTLAAQDTLGTQGARRYQRRAIATVQIFTPANVGTYEALLLAQRAQSVFEGNAFAGLVFDAVTPRELGPDGRWYQVNVDAAFRFYETK